MSILIEGMEMPKNCWECRMVDTEFSFCHAMDSYPKDDGGHYIHNAEIPDWCPLVSIPPHGDLIDRYDLKHKNITIDYGLWDDTFDDGLLFVTDLIDNAPTIIPAEEE